MKNKNRVKYIWKCMDCGREWVSSYNQRRCIECEGDNVIKIGAIVSQNDRKW